MIVTNYELFIEPLKVIDMKCYDHPWMDQGWLTAKEYSWRILEQDGIVMGYCCYRPLGDFLFVAKLCVRPKYRGHGLGSLLMNDLLLASRNKNKHLTTILHEENKFLGWASRWKWIATESKRGFFPDGRDGIVMERRYEPTVS